MFIQTRGPLADLSDYILKKLFVDNFGDPWSSGAWGPSPNDPVVDPQLGAVTYQTTVAASKESLLLVTVTH